MPINEMMFAMGCFSGVRLKEGSWMIGLMRCGWTKMHPHGAADEGDAAESGDVAGQQDEEYDRTGYGGVSMPPDWNAADTSIHWMDATDMMPLGQDAADAMPSDWNAT